MAHWKTSGLMRHEDVRRPRREQAYWCPRCGKQYERFDELQNHMTSVHFVLLASDFG